MRFTALLHWHHRREVHRHQVAAQLRRVGVAAERVNPVTIRA